MGVADNMSYKNMYHFAGKFYQNNPSKLPSLHNDNPKINDSIKENPYSANVEIEKGEIVLDPEYKGLFFAQGKKHSQGGTPVLLKENSFVFSDDKSMSINKEESKLFELKMGGKYRKINNTPSKLLKNNVDVKHYNTLISNIEDQKKDEISKKSSILMLDKYLEKIGQIAFLQESKKGFPNGVPEIAENTAPVYDPNTKEKIMQNKQYMKYGGSILPKAQNGLFNNMRKWMTSGISSELLNNMAQNPALPESVRRLYQNLITKTLDPVILKSIRKNNNISNRSSLKISGIPETEPKKENNNNINNKSKYTKNRYIYNSDMNPDWQFTPFQKESQAYNLFKFASANRYMPFRSKFKASYIDPLLLNPEQSVNDIKSSINSQISSLSNLSPILQNAQSSQAYGQYLDKIPSIRSQYDNQNASIINQTRQYNNQIKNNESLTNMQNDQNYYKESVVGRQNFDNLKSYLSDNYMNNKMRDVETNQQLAYELLTLKNPAWTFDFRSGKIKRNPKNILDAQGSRQSDILENIFSQYLNPSTFNKLDPRVQAALIKSAAVKGLPIYQ